MRTSAPRGLRQHPLSGRPHLPCGRCHVGSGPGWRLPFAGCYGASKTQDCCCHCGEGDGRHQSSCNHTALPDARGAAWALHSQASLSVAAARCAALSAFLTRYLCHFPSKEISSTSKCPARKLRISPGTKLYTDIHRSMTHNGQNVGPAQTPIPG